MPIISVLEKKVRVDHDPRPGQPGYVMRPNPIKKQKEVELRKFCIYKPEHKPNLISKFLEILN